MLPNQSSRLTRPPTLVIGLAGVARIRYRRHLDANLTLLVTLDSELPGTPILLAPDQRQDVPFLDVCIDHAQRQTTAFVVTVAREHGEADNPATHVTLS